MKKIVFYAFMLAIMPLAVCAQSSILWEVSGNGLAEPSYLMGTLKFIGNNEFFMPAEVVSRIKSSKLFAIEDQVDHHAQHELNKVLHFPKGESLSDHVSKEDYELITTFFDKEFGISKSVFEKKYAKLIPLALSITMTRLSLREEVVFFDIELLKVAKKQKTKTYSLEPIEREAQALKAYPIDEQVKALFHNIQNFEKQKKEFSELVKEYPHGDIHKMFELSTHPMENNEEFIEAFYTVRNLEWIETIDKMIHDKPSFIAVGISHLEGEKGLLELLRKKGYTLTPIPVSK